MILPVLWIQEFNLKKYGICTQVFTKTRIEDNEINPDTEVLVIDSESRPLTKEEAYLGVLNITKWAISKELRLFSKKQIQRLGVTSGQN